MIPLVVAGSIQATVIDVELTAVASTFLGSVGAENNEEKRELLNLHHFTCFSHVHVHYT